MQILGHAVVIVRNGHDAVEAVKTVLSSGQRYGLILMDLQMPDMDGYTAARAIRRLEEPYGLHMPVVAVTAHAMPEDRARSLEAGMDDHVSKPINLDTLKSVLERWMPR
ncbi:MAG: response regulator [Chloroflexota bacterium]